MQERMRGILTLFSAGFLFIIIPALLISLHSAPIADYSQSISGVITSPGEYTANVSLGLALYDNSIQNVLSVTSNDTRDNPTAYFYLNTGKRLFLSGMADDTVRTLTIDYGVRSDVNNDVPALSTMMTTVAWLFILAGIAFIAAGILMIFGQL